MVLDSQQMTQLVQEVREALLQEAQGVGDVERVSSLDNLVSLPALWLSGSVEKVVEAPLELLSLPAVQAAADSRKATADAASAAVVAQSAADLADSRRTGLDASLERTDSATREALLQGTRADAAATHAEGAEMHALLTASWLMQELSRGTVALLDMEAQTDSARQLDALLADRLVVTAQTTAEAVAAIDALRTLRLEVATATARALEQTDTAALGSAELQALLAVSRTVLRVVREANAQTDRLLRETTLRLGEADVRLLRLDAWDDVLTSAKREADIAATRADEQLSGIEQAVLQAEQATQLSREATQDTRRATTEATEAELDCRASTLQALLATNHAEGASARAEQSAAGAQSAKQEADMAATRALAAEQAALDATKAATEATDAATEATAGAWDARAQALHLPMIQGDTWWLWDVEMQQYVDSGKAVNSQFVLTRENVEQVLTGLVTTHRHPTYTPQVYAEAPDLASLVSYTDTDGEHTFALGNDIYIADPTEPSGYALYRLSPTADGQQWMRLPQAQTGYRFLLVKN